MKTNNKQKISSMTICVLIISLIILIVGILAVGFLPSFLTVAILDIIYFKKELSIAYRNIKKMIKKSKAQKESAKIPKTKEAIYEYKKGDEIITTKEDSMKKKKKNTSSQKSNNTQKKNKPKKKVGVIIFECFLLFCCFCFMVGISAVLAFCTYIVTSAPKFDPEKLYSVEPSTLYWSDGSVMAVVGTEKRDIITYDELPEVYINALVATEDANFFQHNGIDLKRFLVVSVKQVLGQDDAGGASTLTMQLSKNTYTSKTATGWKGIVRKFTDVYLSVFKIEPTYTKEQIIEFYANTNQLGSTYGVESASKMYFGKSAKDMNISEAALLVGMYQAPSAYNPFLHPEAAEERRQTVLYLLRRHNYITDKEYEIAKKMTVDKIVTQTADDWTGADEMDDWKRSAVDTAVSEVIKRTGDNPRETPMKVYTTFNKNYQEHVGKIMTGETYKWEHENSQAGIAVVDVHNGALVAVGGNRDNSSDNNLNHATQINYQIGSTAKPLYDYGPAFEYLNWSTATVLADEPMDYSDGTKIGNWDGSYWGFRSIREQLAGSRNIPALKTFQLLDKDKIRSFVESLGLHPENYLHEAHSIGGYGGKEEDGIKRGENPLSMAGAYAAFANGGYYTEPYSVTKIVYADGETVNVQMETKQVMSSATAYMITSILQDCAEDMVVPRKQINNVPYAGKTGTTNYDSKTMKANKLPSNAAKDLWVAAYNTDYAISVWYGFDSLKEGYNRMGTKPHRNLFQAVAKKIFTNKANFKMPDTVTKVKIETDSATLMLPSEFTPKKYIKEELFIAGTEPSQVSTRFSKLNDVSDLVATVNGGTVTLSWSPIATPDPFNKTLLKEQNKSAFVSESRLNSYVNTLYKKNVSDLGEVGYNVYVQTEVGLTLLGWTPNTSYTVSGQSGNVTFIVKTCYSKFKNNIADGKSVTIDAGDAPITPTEPTDPTTPDVDNPENPDDTI